MKSKRLVTELETVFYDMNSVSYRTETETVTTTVVDEFGAIAYDEEGEPQTESTTTLYIYIDSRSLDYREGSDIYRFSAEQDEMLTELMRPDYYPLFAELLGDTVGDGGEYHAWKTDKALLMRILGYPLYASPSVSQFIGGIALYTMQRI